MASLRPVKLLLSTCREQSCCLCLQMKHQCRLQPGRDRHAQDTNNQPSSLVGIFWFWISMDSVEQICTSKDEREICHFQRGEMHLSFCKLSSCFVKEGLTGEYENRDWRERESLTSVLTHESMAIGTHDPFLSTALLSATALGAVVPKQRGNKHF